MKKRYLCCSEGSDWEFHFHDVTVLGSVLYGYTWLIPVCLWAGLWWRNRGNQYTLTQFLAIYGYSIAVFIPVVVSVCVHCITGHQTLSPSGCLGVGQFHCSLAGLGCRTLPLRFINISCSLLMIVTFSSISSGQSSMETTAE